MSFLSAEPRIGLREDHPRDVGEEVVCKLGASSRPQRERAIWESERHVAPGARPPMFATVFRASAAMCCTEDRHRHRERARP